ncbi:MAG: hypothetical protein A3J93_05110 [Candidatus Magasanikbacteria bacterium RIFOXYC2_FULL_42_28]|uniref:riboflavin kinase n=1 Tax=Candidatus Magasanikbacteria bacterium RIFOXYC2_FULL_42_28 TaxID=1798704 RepID=A0A1F6NV21_9BACT|nr:MAG: hypothetical protein A3J93_05110 [Candidatus Magasanikbacteria bacterium RIFOXYC2_FULL_42_28]
MKTKFFLGSLAIVISALLWSLDGTFLRPGLFSLPSPLLVFLEHTLGFVVLAPFLFIYRSQLKEINKKSWAAIFWVALFGGALGTTFFTKALFATGFVDISVVILLQKFQPIFAIILAAIFLRERFPREFYAYAGLAVVAGYFVTFKDPFIVSGIWSAPALAAVFSLLAAFAWGSSTVFGKYSLKNLNHGLLAALRFGLTVLIMVFPALYFYGTGVSAVAGKQWWTLITIVFSSGAVAMFLYYWGLKKVPASVSTLCELAWPVSAIIFDYFLNDNVLSTTQILGAFVLVLAAYRATALNQPITFTGKVLPGQGKGEEVGAKTANLDVALAAKLPPGLYDCVVTTEAKAVYSGLLYYGYNSLSQKDCLEVHLLNFSGDLKGQEITVTTKRFLRLPKKFNSLDGLKAKVEEDLKKTKE